MQRVKHRTQISLEDWQYQLLLEISRKTRKSLSGIIRELITQGFEKQRGNLKNSDSLFSLIGLGVGDGSPVARRHDDILYGSKK